MLPLRLKWFNELIEYQTIKLPNSITMCSLFLSTKFAQTWTNWKVELKLIEQVYPGWSTAILNDKRAEQKYEACARLKWIVTCWKFED